MQIDKKDTQTILITGASGAIGGALARAYASPNTTLVLHGRNKEQLAVVEQDCISLGSKVIIGVFDLCDIPQLQAWILDVDYHDPIDLVIVNHGLNSNIGLDGRGEDWIQIDKLIDVNLRASVALIHSVLYGMKLRKHGQIVLISSLAAYFGLPLTPTYCATKSALKAYSESLRGWLAPQGIKVNVVMPGYVKSTMCDAMPGPKPFIWSADKAARIIKKKLVHNPARITFPFPLNFGCWLLSILPPGLSIKILSLLGYRD